MYNDNYNSQKDLHGSAYVEHFNNASQEQRVKQLVQRVSLPPDASILDIGCGTGILSRLLEGRYAQYSGIDFSEDMISAARDLTKGSAHCHFHCADAVGFLDGKIEQFDAIFLLDISEHVADQQWSAIVEAARPALKANGVVYLHTPNLDFFVELLKHHGWIRQFPEHIAVRSQAGNCHFFRDAGSSDVRVSKLPHYNALRYLHPLSRLPIAGKYLAARLWLVASK